MSRFAAVALFNLRIELARARGSTPSPVLAVVIARPGGAVVDETSLLGNTRLDEVSPEAFAHGIRPGHTVAAARARSADLAVRVVPQNAVSRALEGIAEAAMAFGPTIAFEAGGPAGDVVWVDVTGCGHLHAGEAELLTRLAAKVLSMGHACRIALADGPRVAAAVARFGRSSRPLVVPPGENAGAMAKLPLAALGLEEKTRAWLSALALARVADLQRLPRASLGARLGKHAARVLALLEGDDREALRAYVPPDIPTEEAELEYGITSAEALLFVAKRLADRLSARLEGRCRKASRLELVLRLDRLGLEEGEKESTLSVVLASPLARAGELFAVLKTKIEANDREGPFSAPIVAVTVRAAEVVTAHAVPLDLLVPESKAERALPRLASELSAELGHEAVGTLALSDSWVQNERSRLVPFGVPRGPESSGVARFLSGGVEPTRLLAEPFLVKRGELLHPRLVARFEAVEWWRRERAEVEHYVAWVDPMAWVVIDRRSKQVRVTGWLD